MKLRVSRAALFLAAVGLVLASEVSSSASGMVTTGAAGVAGGDATYTIPIVAPPGTAGVAPKMAFTYTSSAGNGPLGVGWGLSGLSAITRCQKTKAQDNTIAAVSYDINDRYCLDGQRLILVSGTYGGNLAEYRTEVETFRKIVSNGSIGSPVNGPAWFKVWTKAGEIIEYGNTTDSRIEAQGKTAVRVWAINKLSDTKQNYQSFTYNEDVVNGDFNITRLDYTGNTATAVAPNASIRFLYQPRTDIQDLRQAGSKIKSTTRLATVNAYSGSTIVRTYTLGYNPSTSTGQSRLTSIQECASGSCLPALTFNWLNHVNTLVPGGTPPTVAHGTFSDAADRIFVGDFNGDGRLDVLLGPSNAGDWHVMRSTGAGLDSSDAPWALAKYAGWDVKRIRVMDFNGDGRSDVVIGPSSAGKWYVLRSTGTSFFDAGEVASGLYGPNSDFPERFHPAELDGDGLPDFIIGPISTGEWYVVRSTGTAFVNGGTWATNAYGAYSEFEERVRIMDVNGDGLSDVVLGPDSDGKWYVMRSSGTSLINDGPWISGAYGGWNSAVSQKRVRVSDANGDGLADIVLGPEATGPGGTTGNWYVLLSTGKSFENGGRWRTGSYGGWDANSDRIRNFDLNGDGLSDVLIGPESTGNWYALLSTGTTFEDKRVWIEAEGAWNGESDRIREMDMTGDGLPDVVIGPSSEGDWPQIHSNPPGDRISSITDGLGQTVSFTYKPLTDSAIYTKDTNASFPTTDLQTPMYVVSTMVASNGIGGTVTTSYKYGGLKTTQGVNGRGSQGFRWMEEKNNSLNLTARTEFQQSWPYTGMPSLMKKLLPGSGSSGVVNQTTYTYVCKNPVTGGNCNVAFGNRYFPSLSNSVETASDLNGAVIPSTTTTYQYDHLYGNLTQMDVVTSDGFSKQTVNTYTNDVVKWFLERLTKSTVTNTSP